MKEKYLPIGTVVLLKDGVKEVMITGLAILGGKKETGEAKIWDYAGCPYPEGIISTSQTFGFDHDKIQKICYMGYETEAHRRISDLAKQEVAKIEEKLNQTEEEN